MLDPRRLLLLRDLARLGTIAAVAEVHAYTASAVSQQLATLEREAGCALLQRTGRRVELTDAGRALVGESDTVLAALESAAAAAVAADGTVGGRVAIGAFPSAVRPVVLPAMLAIDAAAAHVDLEVAEVDPADAPEALLRNRLDLALVHDYDNVPIEYDRGIETARLLDEEVYIASKGAVPQTDSGECDIAALAEQRWIAGSAGTLCHTMLVRMCRHHGFEPRIAHRIDDFAAVLRLVAAGAGVAVVPQLGAVDRPDSLTLTPTGIHRRTRLAYAAGRARRPALAMVIDAVQQAAAGIARPVPG
ncbi:LysR family transcriptional regulator [Jongsikchunia kroppenstedtii]|uniref:LysR family transcriptional regulator n=1 Tax=Jongsikchunia kroppenstedtii TaxID=1121721 RepID=UPI00036E0459|nr:LysR family transcriptional regulator [Jongsikchunia kroppenstedtii]